eukprot:NODE_3170_length_1017_cov_42.633708_g3026_i0.p1 GENE.NODE_3170_length_1017_cov_42.633708_g3026_i0~~NODE_3170_length_1017_cov_42.633708_g3026_i0.p1  ORF type:complete len:337 (-),score=111.26 NODE_3170_length_1017_cov_42.633708_g3026_i0:6-980(-)
MADPEALLQQVLALQREDKVLQAHEALVALEALCGPPTLAGLQERLGATNQIHTLKGLAQQVYDLRRSLSASTDWVLQSECFGVTTYFKHVPSQGPFHLLVRVEGEVEAPLLDILTLLCEIDLWPGRLFPKSRVCGLADSQIVQHPQPTHLLCYLRARLPWPVCDREIYLQVRAVDCMGAAAHNSEGDRCGQIVVLLNSVEEFPGAVVPPEGADVVRAAMQLSGVILTPTLHSDGGAGRTFLQLQLCVDPKLAYMPQWVLDMFVKNIMFVFIPYIRKEVKEVSKPGSVYADRRARHPELYEYLRRRMQECLHSNPSGEHPPTTQ